MTNLTPLRFLLTVLEESRLFRYYPLLLYISQDQQKNFRLHREDKGGYFAQTGMENHGGVLPNLILLKQTMKFETCLYMTKSLRTQQHKTNQKHKKTHTGTDLLVSGKFCGLPVFLCFMSKNTVACVSACLP